MSRPELPLQQLHAFAVLAEELHFGRAAARLGIAQPPLSQQIRRLEDKVGFPLFTRTTGRIALTPAGAELLPAAHRALDGLAEALAAARAVGGGRAGTVRIGFAASLALTLVPGILRRFGNQYPDVDIRIQEMTTAVQTAALHDRILDVGLLREPADDEELEFRTVLTEPFLVALPRTHPLAALRRVPLSSLANSPFVLLPREVGPNLHDQIVGLCTAAGFTPRVAHRAVEWQTTCALVEADLGIALVPESVRRIRLDGVVFRHLDPTTAHTRVAAAWRKDDHNPLIRHLEAIIAHESQTDRRRDQPAVDAG